MDERHSAIVGRATRRKMIGRLGIALTGLAASVRGSQNMVDKPGSVANKDRTSLHMEVPMKASAERLYDTLLDAKQFGRFSRAAAEIEPKAGGAFSLFDGQIVGRNIELIPGQRIVQAWRPTHWDEGVYSIVRFEFRPQGSGIMTILDHIGFPRGDYDHLLWGWNAHYFQPLNEFLT
jgi:activator of HSP90 ATPase